MSDIDKDDHQLDHEEKYEVGYGKPPKAAQWTKGQSGNPRGRRKGARGLKSDLEAELATRMEIHINGAKVSHTKQRLMLKTLSARAASGNMVAIKTLTELVMQIFGPEDRGREARRLSRQDQQILDQLLAGHGGADSGPGEPALLSGAADDEVTAGSDPEAVEKA